MEVNATTFLVSVVISTAILIGLASVPQILAALASRTNERYGYYVSRIWDFVHAAEMTMGQIDGIKGEDKLDFVLDRVGKYLPDLDQDQARLIIESVVKQMRQGEAGTNGDAGQSGSTTGN